MFLVSEIDSVGPQICRESVRSFEWSSRTDLSLCLELTLKDYLYRRRGSVRLIVGLVSGRTLGQVDDLSLSF